MRVSKWAVPGCVAWTLSTFVVTNCLAQVVINGVPQATQGETAILQKMGQYPWWQTILSTTIAGILAIVLSELVKAARGRLPKNRGGRRPDDRRSAAKTRPPRSHPRADGPAARIRRNGLR